MYRADGELTELLAHLSLFGRRRHGHFDHDAHEVIGPNQAPSQARNVSKLSGTTTERRVTVRSYIDQESGDLLSD